MAETFRNDEPVEGGLRPHEFLIRRPRIVVSPLQPGNADREAPLFRENPAIAARSEEHTSELQSQSNLVCRLLLEKKKTTATPAVSLLTHTPSPGHSVPS